MNRALNRRPLSPDEFRARVQRLLELREGGRITSTWRSEGQNSAVGGSPESKHLWGPLTPIAVDIVWNYVSSLDLKSRQHPDTETAVTHALETYHTEVLEDAKTLGLYGIVHDKGSGIHLHLQAVPPGELSTEYKTKFNIWKQGL